MSTERRPAPSPALPLATPALLWLRAGLLTAVAITSGTTAHVTAGGLLPGAFGLVVLNASALLGVAALLRRRASTVRIVALVLGTQTFVHFGLTAMAGHRGVGSSPSPSGAALPQPSGTRTGSYYDVAYAGSQSTPPAGTGLGVPAPVQHLLHDVTGPDALMGLAHLAAGAVLALWLALGERVLWELLVLTGARVSRWWARLGAGAPSPAPWAGVGLCDLGRTSRALPAPRHAPIHCIARRGPPVAALTGA